MSDQPDNCQKPSVAGSTCIERLAGGWILPADLCPVCTAGFIAALDGIEGVMAWHPDFRRRAGETVVQP